MKNLVLRAPYTTLVLTSAVSFSHLYVFEDKTSNKYYYALVLHIIFNILTLILIHFYKIIEINLKKGKLIYRKSFFKKYEVLLMDVHHFEVRDFIYIRAVLNSNYYHEVCGFSSRRGFFRRFLKKTDYNLNFNFVEKANKKLEEYKNLKNGC